MGKQFEANRIEPQEPGTWVQVDQTGKALRNYRQNQQVDMITGIAWAIIGILLVFCICCLFFIYGTETARAEDVPAWKQHFIESDRAEAQREKEFSERMRLFDEGFKRDFAACDTACKIEVGKQITDQPQQRPDMTYRPAPSTMVRK
jgi:hypothetical protein